MQRQNRKLASSGAARFNGVELRRTPARPEIKRAPFAGALIAVAALFLASTNVEAIAQQAGAEQAERTVIKGMVRDAAGKPVGDATVRIEQKGAPSVEVRSDAQGAFEFPATAAGSYRVSAEKDGLRSRIAEVNSPISAREAPIVLTLQGPGSADFHAAPSSSEPPMEFADAPNFTVAAVTDWTAAGGHGSDASLRTSEALTRETLSLKPQGASGAATDNAAARSANLHRISGERDETQGDPLAAVREFEQAVREDPSEQNYFEWGSELLLHRAVLQAKDVFAAGAKLYPKSARMLTALGAALFAGAFYDEAAQRLCDASDLTPTDPEPYVFMGKVEMAAPNPLACVEQKLARFVALQPDNPLANFFYAMTVWKQHGQSVDSTILIQVEAMLTKAVSADPKCGDAYLQLGVLHSSKLDYRGAIGYYTKAIEANPQMSEAHYRLGVAFDRVGDHARAKHEFQLHDDIDKQQKAEVERQRREVKQFLVVTPDKTFASPVH
jgi:tetratricopeptide (TPR) repeat protein